MENKFVQEVRAMSPWLKEVFCQIHQNPELGNQEFKTQALILSELEKMGVKGEKIIGTGVVATIYGGKPGKTIAFRGDMDALPIEEKTDLPYKSQVPGVMHACGHDLHTTALLGIARWFVNHKEEMCGNLKLLFQPNEEGNGGAKRMVEAGCMENPKVDAVFFGHCVTIPLGQVTVRVGAMSASDDPFMITFRGKGTHGAQPQNGTDTIVGACQVITALQTVCSRRTHPSDSVLLTIGSIHGGVEGNGSIIPEIVKVDGILRTHTPENRTRARNDLIEIATGVAAAMGIQAEITWKEGFTASINDEGMTNLMRKSAAKIFGEENILPNPPGLGAEDFGYFSDVAPGCYYRFGVGDPKQDHYYPLHNAKFQLDPEALTYAVALFAQITNDYLG